jgi:hypothetical protein
VLHECRNSRTSDLNTARPTSSDVLVSPERPYELGNWGADFPGSPVDVHQYSPQPITEFDISVSKWSDGTAAPVDAH